MGLSMVPSDSTGYTHQQGPMQKAQPKDINIVSSVSTHHDIYRLCVVTWAIHINLTVRCRKIMNPKVALSGSMDHMDHRHQNDPRWQHDPNMIDSIDHEHLHNLM